MEIGSSEDESLRGTTGNSDTEDDDITSDLEEVEQKHAQQKSEEKTQRGGVKKDSLPLRTPKENATRAQLRTKKNQGKDKITATLAPSKKDAGTAEVEEEEEEAEEEEATGKTEGEEEEAEAEEEDNEVQEIPQGSQGKKKKEKKSPSADNKPQPKVSQQQQQQQKQQKQKQRPDQKQEKLHKGPEVLKEKKEKAQPQPNQQVGRAKSSTEEESSLSEYVEKRGGGLGDGEFVPPTPLLSANKDNALPPPPPPAPAKRKRAPSTNSGNVKRTASTQHLDTGLVLAILSKVLQQ